MKSKIIILSSLILALFSACADLEEEPIGVLTPESYFLNEVDFEAAILGLYNTNAIDIGVWTDNLYVDILSDEYDVDATNFRPYRFLFNEYRFNPSDYRDDFLWRLSFTQITWANIILSKAGETEIAEEIKDQFKAEALFFRALTYFGLVRLFGDVPYLEAPLPNPSDASVVERTPAEEVYQHIIDDLIWAADHLPNQFAGVRNRATRGAALTLLAKVHLTLATYNEVYEGAYNYRNIDQSLVENLKGTYSSHWEAAAECALEVINNKGLFGYDLVEDFQDLFNGEIGDTEEHIFSIDFFSESKGGGVAGQTFDGWHNNNNAFVAYRKPLDVGGWNTIVPPIELFNTFFEGDYRRDVSFEETFAITTAPVGGDTTGTIHYTALIESMIKEPFCAKWTRFPGPCESWPSGVAASYNIAIFRYGELLLIAAEALNEIGRTAEAIPLINELRARARNAGGQNRLTPADVPAGLSQIACWDTIWQERCYELAFEWKRWYDLVRRDSLQAVMSRFVPDVKGSAIGSDIQPYHILLPIPQSEIDLTNFQQNKGY